VSAVAVEAVGADAAIERVLLCASAEGVVSVAAGNFVAAIAA
jgi:hypothetical protein